MDKLQDNIGYHFKNLSLLQTALTHSSFSNESHDKSCQCYERLEFLGDSILGLVTADFLYRWEPPIPEGRMTRLRAELVCEGSLHKIALALSLGEYMRLGRGEAHTGGRERPSILADMVEAIIAAIYLDSGMDEARRFIMDKLLSHAEIDEGHQAFDYKTKLQELVQQRNDRHVTYEMISESGPDHNKVFFFRACVNGESIGEGSGRTKKEAEQMAARMALEVYKA